MFRGQRDYFELEDELEKIKELIKRLFTAKSPKEFIETQEELKKYAS